MVEPSLLRAEILLPEAASFARLDGAMTTPFQTTGWVKHFLEAHDEIGRLRLLRLMTPGGAEILIPLLVRRHLGQTVAMKIGDAHASYFTPGLVGDVPALTRAELVPALRQAARGGAIDVLLFEDMLPLWRGSRNPLMALTPRMAPNDAAFLTLGDDADAVLGFLLDKDARKKLRAKWARLGDRGLVEARWVQEPAAIETALALFFFWKSQQFAERGLRDAFADEAIRRFLVRAVHDPEHGIRIFALFLAGRPIALIGGALHDGHYAAMFMAYDARPEIAKHSPGEVMLQALLPALIGAGCRGFDLGAGDARYKTRFCPEKQTLFDAALGISLGGGLYALVWRMARRLKGRIKRNPRLMAAVTWWRQRRRKAPPAAT